MHRLIYACRYKYTGLINLLIEKGADPFIKNRENKSPVDIVREFKLLRILEVMLSKKGNIQP